MLGALMGCCLVFSLKAQSDAPKNYRNFPLVLTLQFHSLSMPFKNTGANFSNVGIGLGTELSLNGKHNWAQQFSAVWYRNKAVGNGLLFYTQSSWRPELVSGSYAELKAGAGYLYAFRPVRSFRQENGRWIAAGQKGKGMFTLPVGVSLGYNPSSSGTRFSPFASYQFLILSGYNKSIPLVPETLIQIGSRIHLNEQ